MVQVWGTHIALRVKQGCSTDKDTNRNKRKNNIATRLRYRRCSNIVRESSLEHRTQSGRWVRRKKGKEAENRQSGRRYDALYRQELVHGRTVQIPRSYTGKKNS